MQCLIMILYPICLHGNSLFSIIFQVTKGVSTNVHPPSVPSLGWDVTSDLQLEVGERDSRLALTCLAVSRGHFGDAMAERAEKEVVVLSE